MSAASDYLEQKLLDHTFNKVAYTSPATYVALYTAAPGETGGGTEVTGGSYARVLVNENASGSTPKWKLATATTGLVENLNDIVFPTATASWGTVSHTAVLDAASAGNVLVYGALAESKTVGNNDIFKFLADAFDVTLA